VSTLTEPGLLKDCVLNSMLDKYLIDLHYNTKH